jgi:hypothetical protein
MYTFVVLYILQSFLLYFIGGCTSFFHPWIVSVCLCAILRCDRWFSNWISGILALIELRAVTYLPCRSGSDFGIRIRIQLLVKFASKGEIYYDRRSFQSKNEFICTIFISILLLI